MSERITPVVRTLLLLNVAIFLAQLILQIPLPDIFGLRYFEAKDFAPWQFLTYMFIHGNEMHLFSNMLGLFMFGRWIETVLGSRRFLAFYMVCGMGAGFLYNVIIYAEHQVQKNALVQYAQAPDANKFIQYLEDYEPEYYKRNPEKCNNYVKEYGIPESVRFLQSGIEARKEMNVMVGASGAIFGILVAFMLLFPNIEMMMIFLPVPIKAKYMVTFYIIYEMIAGAGYFGQSNVAHLAHLAGALVGFLLIRFWKIPRQY
ncbi:MAG: rhomboid family intramembrane serine protease [Bacteroidetes bacterium]|nr:MAG: rhomboid family intramembrane serine protease [Bacteroidota bacterium]